MIKNIYVREEDIGLWRQFEEIVKKEGGKSKILRDLIAEYIKKHGEGNPSFQIDKWVEDPKFKAYPAFYSDWIDAPWKEYTLKELDQIEGKTLEILSFVREEISKR